MDIDEFDISYMDYPTLSSAEKTKRKLRRLCKCLEEGCTSEFRFKSGLIRHLKFTHKVAIQYEKKTFNSLDEFNAWRSIYEEETNSQYVLCKKVAQDLKTLIYYNCNRSGLSRDRGGPVKLRATKVQGSCKIGSVCPSHIILKMQKENKVIMRFWKTHYGHTEDIEHLRISPSVRFVIAEHIAKGVPMEIALGKLKEPSDEIKRTDLITKKDIHNIAHSFKLSLGEGQKHEDKGVDMFVKDCMESCAQNPILCYKKQGEEFLGLNKSDFCLIIMNRDQRDIFQQYGNYVCVDSKQGINAQDFTLTTVLVLDESNPYPVSFMYSNRDDNTIFEFFFEKVKRNINLNTPLKYFMSDIKDKYYLAWEKVMGSSNYRMYSSWHVYKAFGNATMKIKNTEKRRQVLNQCKDILQLNDITLFQFNTEMMLNNLSKDSDTKHFADYFSKHFMKNCHLWAKCYHPNLDVNTNNLNLDKLHKTLVYNYAKGVKVRRLDKSISNLLNYMKEKQEERLLQLLSENQFQFINKHESINDLENESIEVIDNGWIVNGYFIAIKLQKNCCQLMCSQCDICVHRYTCTCPDYQTNVIICKHIHYLLSIFNENSSYTFEIPLEHVDNEISVNTEEDIFPEWNGQDEITICVTTNESNKKDKITKEIEETFNSIQMSLSGLDEPALHEILKRAKGLEKMTTSLKKNKQIKTV